jgi:hypothetical protein
MISTACVPKIQPVAGQSRARCQLEQRTEVLKVRKLTVDGKQVRDIVVHARKARSRQRSSTAEVEERLIANLGVAHEVGVDRRALEEVTGVKRGRLWRTEEVAGSRRHLRVQATGE